MTVATRSTGQKGEQVAQKFLQMKGFRLVAANWRFSNQGELDLVMRHARQNLLIFAEVKTRKSRAYGAPEAAVHAGKQARMRALAEGWLAENPQPPDRLLRFDVVSVFFPGAGQPAEIHHFENAF